MELANFYQSKESFTRDLAVMLRVGFCDVVDILPPAQIATVPIRPGPRWKAHDEPHSPFLKRTTTDAAIVPSWKIPLRTLEATS